MTFLATGLRAARCLVAATLQAAAATAVAMLIAACESHSPGSSVTSLQVGTALAARQELVRGVDAGSMRSFDPSISTDIPAERVLDDIFEGLTRLDQSGEPAPGLATQWETSSDGRTWTFHLREARWSNGEPIRAADFVFAWRRTVDPRTASDYGQALAAVRNAIDVNEGRAAPETLGIEAPDDHTVVVHLNAPTPYLLSLMSKAYTYPQYAPAISAYGNDWTDPSHIVGNGAFLLRERVIGGRVTLTRNPQYWNAAQVRLQTVVYLPLDRAVQTDRFFAGDLAFTDSFSAEQTAWLRSRLGSQVVSAPYLGNFVLGVNSLLPPFAGNRELRLALTMALDRETLVRYVRQGLYQPAWTPTPPLPGYRVPLPEWATLPEAQRHALARHHYQLAGYSARHPLQVELYYPTDTDNRRTYEAVAAMWRSNLGAEVHTYNEEFRVQINERHLKKLALFHYAWIGDYPDPYTFLQLFRTGFGYNDGGYSNPRYDSLLKRADMESDAGARLALLAEAETLLNDDVACIPIYYYASRHLIKAYLRGWTSNIQDRNLSQYMYVLEHQGS